MNNSIVATIVIYNKSIENSITCKNILSFNEDLIEILIVDNSTSNYGNKAYCEKKNIKYISMGGNQGLSKAYNAAIDLSKDKDVIILFDDDTDVTKQYFEQLQIALDSNPDVDIFAPIIYGQDGVIYSPNRYNFMRSQYIQEISQEIPQEEFNAIASCLAIRMRVFQNYRFNEKLFVDQVDQNFFYDQRKKNKKFMKLNVEIKQNFYQRGLKLSAESGWKRLRLRIIDIMRQTRIIGGIKVRFLGFLKCCGLGLQIGKKCKSYSVPFKSLVLAIRLVFVDE